MTATTPSPDGTTADADAAPAAPSAPSRSAKIIDGKAIAAEIRSEIKAAVSEMRRGGDRTSSETDGGGGDFSPPIVPGLAVILVGSRRDSQTYVRMKKRACEEVGVASFGYDHPETVSQSTIEDEIRKLNSDPAVHGILVQLPLPPHLDEGAILGCVDPQKDVDGLHPLNVAALCSTSTRSNSEGEAAALDWSDLSSLPFHVPCTPQGCVELLDRSGVELGGKTAAVVGRSNLVGLPIAMLLMHRDATVTVVHSKTPDPSEVVSKADVVIAAAGRAGIVRGDWIKEGAVVIDVGINSVDDDSTKRGYRLVGDVDYDEARGRAGMITPVPGGVGPMTIAMLLRNTLNSCRRSLRE